MIKQKIAEDKQLICQAEDSSVNKPIFETSVNKPIERTIQTINQSICEPEDNQAEDKERTNQNLDLGFCE